jgi:hypothetical protein
MLNLNLNQQPHIMEVYIPYSSTRKVTDIYIFEVVPYLYISHKNVEHISYLPHVSYIFFQFHSS